MRKGKPTRRNDAQDSAHQLVEAEKTELVNFVPPDIVERMSRSMAGAAPLG